MRKLIIVLYNVLLKLMGALQKEALFGETAQNIISKNIGFERKRPFFIAENEIVIQTLPISLKNYSSAIFFLSYQVVNSLEKLCIFSETYRQSLYDDFEFWQQMSMYRRQLPFYSQEWVRIQMLLFQKYKIVIQAPLVSL